MDAVVGSATVQRRVFSGGSSHVAVVGAEPSNDAVYDAGKKSIGRR